MSKDTILKLINYIKQQKEESESSELSYSSSQKAFYRHMASSADLKLQMQFLEDSKLVKVEIRSKKASHSPRNKDTEGGTGHMQYNKQPLSNSLTPVPHKEDDMIIDMQPSKYIVVRTLNNEDIQESRHASSVCQSAFHKIKDE